MTGIANASQLRVLHTADLHLDRPFASWGDAGATRQQDLLDTMETIGELAREQRVQLVLLAGDQFDRHNPESSTVQRFRGWLNRLNREGIQVALICGNHDSYWYEASVYRQSFPANTVLFTEPACENPTEINVNGIHVNLYGIAHDHTQHREVMPGFRRRADDGIHIGLIHATVDPPADFNVADRYLPTTAAELRTTGLDYVALGHIHRARTFNAGGPGMAAYPGSPEALDMDEFGPRSVNLLTFSGGPPTLETIPCGIRTASRERIDCTSLSDEEIALRIASHAGDDVILTAVLTGAPLELPDTDGLRSRLADRFCHLHISNSTSVVDTGFVREIEGERTIRGRFVQRLREQIAAAESDREREKAELALRVGLVALQQRSAQ